MKRTLSASTILLMIIAFMIYSTTGIFMKLASMESHLSFLFILYYCMALGVIAAYAVLWQIILKKIPLTIAFMSKSITIIFSLIIAYLVFSESITINNIIGSVIIISGIVYLGWGK